MSNRTRRLLILDLDETLIHATEQPLGRAADFRLEHYHVYCRPYVNSFLQKMAEIYDLAVWSSATQDYVAGIVARIMPEGIEPKFTWGRGQCTRRYDPEWREDYYRKDLRKVKRLGYDLDDSATESSEHRRRDSVCGAGTTGINRNPQLHEHGTRTRADLPVS